MCTLLSLAALIAPRGHQWFHDDQPAAWLERPEEVGVITFRLRPSDRPPMNDLANPEGWGFVVFVPLQEDVPPDSLAIRRDTRVLITVEKITDAVGRLVYNAPDSRELLWKKLAPP